jgi:hypothetical protein
MLDDASTPEPDAMLDQPCTPTSFGADTPIAIAPGVQSFSIATDETFGLLTINGRINYLLSPTAPGTPIVAQGFGSGTVFGVALTHESDHVLVNYSPAIMRSSPVGSVATWDTPISEPGLPPSITVARPNAGATRMVISDGSPDLTEYEQTGAGWVTRATHRRLLLVAPSNIGAVRYPSLSADGLVMVYVLTGSDPASGVNYATRAALDQEFVRVDQIFPGGGIIWPQLTASCRHLWYLPAGGQSLTLLAH